MADERLDEKTGEGPTEPDDAGEGVGDAELLNVGSEERELKCPTELYAAGH